MSDTSILDTPEGIAFYRMAMLKAALSIEIKTGLRTWRHTTAYAVAKRAYNLKGSREKVLEQLCRMVDETLHQNEGVGI